MVETNCYFEFDCGKGKIDVSNCILCPAYYPIYSAGEIDAMSKAIDSDKVIYIENFRRRGK